MAFPITVTLPDNARYYNFVETTKSFNSNYDITWSFSYYFPASSIQSHNNYQLGFATFLTSLSSTLSALPGQYLGGQDPAIWLNSLNTEAGEALLTEGSEIVRLENFELSGILVKVAFDSTGLYALTGRTGQWAPSGDGRRSGVGLETDCFREALVVRDFKHNVVANAPLSTMSTTFSTLSTDTYRTLRFRYINLGKKLHIDVRESDTTTYSLLTTVNLNFSIADLGNQDNIYVGFSLCTPISTESYALSAGNLYLRNFHIEGYENDTVLTETVTTPMLSVVSNDPTTTVSNITA
jgi:hypothetical protein|tara:strand:- start:292 stop:1176 length:885 start_codon:yes stop_codon:yes gene_type:complete